LKFRPGLARLIPEMNTMTLATTSSPTSHERIAAAIAHGGTCVAWFFAPLIIYLMERDRSSYAARQALQALLWSGLGTLVSLATCGLAIPIFMGFHILAAVRVLEGQEYEYPFVADLVRKVERV
jgi:uncharacterized protein